MTKDHPPFLKALQEIDTARKELDTWLLADIMCGVDHIKGGVHRVEGGIDRIENQLEVIRAQRAHASRQAEWKAQRLKEAKLLGGPLTFKVEDRIRKFMTTGKGTVDVNEFRLALFMVGGDDTTPSERNKKEVLRERLRAYMNIANWRDYSFENDAAVLVPTLDPSQAPGA